MKNVMISVIMPNYNTPISYLREAVDSILAQTYTDFEFIIIDDASNDESLKYLESLNDSRIRLIKNDKNEGITKSLNIGIMNAKGKYIARMDSDDIADPTRFEVQLNYMEENTDVVVCGAWFEKFGVETAIRKPSIRDFEWYRCQLLFSNTPITLCHPSAMFRKDVLDKNNILYDESLRKAQDYGMWVSCSRVGRIAVIEQVLMKYRTHSRQISINNNSEQAKCADLVSERQLENLGLGKCHRLSLWRYGKVNGIKDFRNYYYWLNSICVANENSGIYEKEVLKKYTNTMLLKTIKQLKKRQIIAIFLSENNYLRRLISTEVLNYIKRRF